jgi:hypothetical protein
MIIDGGRDRVEGGLSRLEITVRGGKVGSGRHCDGSFRGEEE